MGHYPVSLPPAFKISTLDGSLNESKRKKAHHKSVLMRMHVPFYSGLIAEHFLILAILPAIDTMEEQDVQSIFINLHQ